MLAGDAEQLAQPRGDAAERSRLYERIGEALAKVGLSYPKYEVLENLRAASEPLSLGVIAECQSCARSNITQLVDKLEAEGLVQRVADPEDRRGIRAELTEAGRERVVEGRTQLDLVVAEDVTAPIDLPSFDNSAMDGYAVVQADVASASGENPVHLPVVGEIGAGTARILALSPGTAVKIMTGAPVPQGADAVVPVEWTDGGAATVRVHRAPTAGQHVRRQGEDVRAGDVLLEEDALLGPRQVGLLASVGRAQVRSRPRPR